MCHGDIETSFQMGNTQLNTDISPPFPLPGCPASTLQVVQKSRPTAWVQKADQQPVDVDVELLLKPINIRKQTIEHGHRNS